MGSTRLPGKVLRPLGGRPVLSWVLRAAAGAAGVDQVVLATTTLAEDDPLEALAREAGVAVVRGPVDDVLDRFLLALDAHPADALVRLTADCPLLDPALIAGVVAAWRAAPGETDYVATTLTRTLPRGLDVELVTAATLRQAGAEARDHDRVHVTSSVWSRPERHRLLGLVVAPAAADLRVTLDTAEDARALEAIVAELGDRAPGWREVVALLRARPDLVALNAEVRQKDVTEG
jgi:spore coat polysaccharide biosynthesis protein SpsF